MIIAHVFYPRLKPYVHINHMDYKNNVIKAPNTYHLVSEMSDYITNNDTILFTVGIDYKSLATVSLSNILSKEQLDAIKSKKILLAIDLSIDGKFETIEYIYKYVIQQENLPPEQILFIGHSPEYSKHIDDISKKYNYGKIKYECFEYWARTQQLTFIDTLKNLGYADYKNYQSGLYKSTSKSFLCLNSTWKEHRVALLSILNHKRLLDKAYYSFSGKPSREGLYERLVQTKQEIPKWLLDEQNNTLELNWDSWIDTAAKTFTRLESEIRQGANVINRLPLVLDNKNFETNIAYLTQTYLLKYYKDTYFSVVTETFFEKDEPLFLTEKIYKPISHKHPFIVLGQPHTLKVLKSYGYKTFEGMIDESYDDELDHSKRLSMVADEVERLCNLNEQELTQFKEGCLPIVEYNFNKFINEKSFIHKML